MFYQNLSENMYKLMIFNRFFILFIVYLIGSVLVVVSSYCPDDEYSKTCCDRDEFLCANGYCILEEGLCDGVMDCADNSDELGCYNVTCKERNIDDKCDQTCTDVSETHSRCTCRKGYALKPHRRFKKLFSCQDVDECAIGVDTCDQICENVAGEHTCYCKEGFVEMYTLYGSDYYPVMRCEARDNNVKILYSSDNWIHSYSKKNRNVTPVVYAGKVDEMEYDPVNDVVYWSTGDIVSRSYLPGAKCDTVTVGHRQSFKPAGISHIENSFVIDWKTDNLYWISINTSSVDRYQIKVSKPDGRYVKTLVDNIFNASSLVVDPAYGMMYWISGGKNATIEASWMNGKRRRNLLNLTNQSPTALTLDALGNRIYWVDSKTNAIFMMLKDGTRPTIIIKTDEPNRPLMMDVFESNLYWITKGSNKLVMQNKFGRDRAFTLVSNLINQTSIKVHHKNQVEANKRKLELFCETCTPHLCLNTPRGYLCACPDGSRTNINLYKKTIICDAENVDSHLG